MRSFNKLLSAAGLSVVLVFTLATANAIGQSSRIYIIDRLAADAVNQIDDAAATDKIFSLPDKGNPLAIITEELKQNSYSEIHLFLLTKPGSLIFDELNILAENVGENGSHFNDWKKYLSPGAKIIIHSDSLTSVPEGVSLVERISEMTGVPVVVQN